MRVNLSLYIKTELLDTEHPVAIAIVIEYEESNMSSKITASFFRNSDVLGTIRYTTESLYTLSSR